MFWLFLIASMSTVFIVRTVPMAIWGKPGITIGDVMNHLNIIDGYRKNKHRVPDLSDKYLFAERENYPSFLHWLFSYMPESMFDRFEPFWGSIVESLNGALIFVCCYSLAVNISGLNSPELVGFCGSLLFAMSPILPGIETYTRVSRFSPRPFATLLNACTFLALTSFMVTDNWAWLILGAGISAITGLSSKFGVQALVFITCFISLFSLDARPLMLLPISFAFAVLISRGHYLQVLAGHFHHSHFYCTFQSNKHLATTAYTYKQLVTWPIILFNTPLEAARLLVTNYVMISVTLFPWAVLLAISYLFQPSWTPSISSFEKFLLIWVLSGYSAMLVTMFKRFQFLGEPSRYVIHSATPVCILVPIRVFEADNPLLWQLSAIAAFASVIGIAGIYAVIGLTRIGDEDRSKLYDWCRKQPSCTFLAINMRLSFLLCFRTPHRAVHLHTNVPRGKKLEEYKRLIPKWYPWPSLDLLSNIHRHKVDLLVVDENAVNKIRQKDPSYVYDFSVFDEIFHQGRFRVYKPKPEVLAQFADNNQAA